MRFPSPETKLEIVLRSYSTGGSLAVFAKKTGVSRQTVYDWRKRLTDSAGLIFGHGSLGDRLRMEQKTNRQLLSQIAHLRDILGQNDIKDVTLHKDDETEYDDEAGDDGAMAGLGNAPDHHAPFP